MADVKPPSRFSKRSRKAQIAIIVVGTFLLGAVLLSAGAAGLAWTLYLLARHPEAQERAAREVETVLQGRPATADDVARLSYTGRVIKESLRLYTPTWTLFPREAVQAVEVGGYRLPRGSWVFIFPYALHRDARWFEEPAAFRPERWAKDLVQRLPRFAYFPFGGGPRQCIGNGFALMEAILILATIAQRFRLSPIPGQRITPTPYVTLRPEPGIRVQLARR